MIEIVFSDRACGGLKMAQTWGKGQYLGGAVGVILGGDQSGEPTEQEVREAEDAARERFRKEWEAATPMGGNPDDVYGFSLMLSMGDIGQADFARSRQAAIDALWRIYPGDACELADGLPRQLDGACQAIFQRAMSGEPLRLWYSSQPDELCGLYWFMAELEGLAAPVGKVYAVQLPECEEGGENTLVEYRDWGEISPGEWHRYTALAQALTPAIRRCYAMRWRALQRENAPLRAVLNGRLMSVSEKLYDPFIAGEIAHLEEVFSEAVAVGRVLGRCGLKIGDAWVARRIDAMVEAGYLSAVTEPEEGLPAYHRKLRKNPEKFRQLLLALV